MGGESQRQKQGSLYGEGYLQEAEVGMPIMHGLESNMRVCVCACVRACLSQGVGFTS